jgi:hypothetical protein
MRIGDAAEIFEGAQIVLGDAVAIGIHPPELPLRERMAASAAYCSEVSEVSLAFRRPEPPSSGAAASRAGPKPPESSHPGWPARRRRQSRASHRRGPNINAKMIR